MYSVAYMVRQVAGPLPEMTYSERPTEVVCQRAPFDEVPTSGVIIVSELVTDIKQ